MEDKVISPEKAEEAKLKARYPNLGAKPGGSDLLRKRLQKGVRFIPKVCLSKQYQLQCSHLVAFFFVFSSKSILTLVTTTWPRQKWRINNCHQPQRRRQRSQVGTSQHLRTCLKERLQLLPVNWLVDGFMFIVLLPFQPPLHFYLPFTFLFLCHLRMYSLRTSHVPSQVLEEKWQLSGTELSVS